MQKWEYCVLGNIYTAWRKGRTHIHGGGPYGAATVLKGESFRPIPGSKDGVNIVAEMDRLGAEGWEMAGCGSFETGHCIYFKRPKE